MDDEVVDLITQVHVTLSEQRDSCGGPGVGDVTKRQRDRDKPERRRQCKQDKVVNSPVEERGGPHIWFFMAMLSAIEMTLKAQIATLIQQDVGKTEAVELIRKTFDNSTAFRLNTRVKACSHLPIFAWPGRPHKSRFIFAVDGFASYRWKKQEVEVDQRGPPCAPSEEVLPAQDGSDKRRMKIQDLIRHTQRPNVPQGRAPRGNMAWQLGDAVPKAEKGKGKGAREKAPMELAN